MSISKLITIKAKLNREQTLLNLLKNMVAESKKEMGCLTYDLYQQTQNPREFSLMETWANLADLEAHKQSEHFKTFVLKAPELIEGKSSVELIHHT
ncbi:putative quinol monooxygenase [Novipirellula artificiosorum]|uniref:Putative monooxygenase YcnE n=1 Tax=Novipirellula artificiosorum TaxID=2528016 RepID=A0A5C6DVM5_9BACT|nr:putative quinol monooxygenase [Novipirellula artificiosorum]TWU40395.1 putative monooxygenase YcnE [Novipirellula artificiosorum]